MPGCGIKSLREDFKRKQNDEKWSVLVIIRDGTSVIASFHLDYFQVKEVASK